MLRPLRKIGQPQILEDCTSFCPCSNNESYQANHPWIHVARLVQNGCSKTCQVFHDWREDGSNYTQQQIGEMPNWIPQQK